MKISGFAVAVLGAVCAATTGVAAEDSNLRQLSSLQSPVVMPWSVSAPRSDVPGPGDDRRRLQLSCSTIGDQPDECCVALCDLECGPFQSCGLTTLECVCTGIPLIFVLILAGVIVASLAGAACLVSKLKGKEGHLREDQRVVDNSAVAIMFLVAGCGGLIGLAIYYNFLGKKVDQNLSMQGMIAANAAANNIPVAVAAK